MMTEFSFYTNFSEKYLKRLNICCLSVTTVKTNRDFSEQSLLSNSDMLQFLAVFII